MPSSHPEKPARPRLLGVLLLLPFLLLATACKGGGDEDDDEEETKTRPALLVRTVSPERSGLDRTLEITAEVNPLHQADIAPRIGGVPLLEIRADVGDQVEAGQLLATLEDTDLRQKVREQELALAESRIRVEDAKLTLKELEAELSAQQITLEQRRRVKERAEKQGRTISVQDREQSEFDYKTEIGRREKLKIQIKKAEVAERLAAEAVSRLTLDLEKARREVGFARVTAPFKGVISERLANQGQMAQTGTALFKMFDPTHLAVDAYVPQQALQDVRPGLRVAVQTDALPGKQLDGKVSLVAPVVDRESGTLMVRLALDDVASLKPGLFVAGSIVLETRANALTIPRKCVAYERERPFVYRVVPRVRDADSAETEDDETDGADWQVERLYFIEGLSGGERVEFVPRSPTETLAVNDRLVLVGLDRLRDGDAVRVEAAATGKSAN